MMISKRRRNARKRDKLCRLRRSLRMCVGGALRDGFPPRCPSKTCRCFIAVARRKRTDRMFLLLDIIMTCISFFDIVTDILVALEFREGGHGPSSISRSQSSCSHKSRTQSCLRTFSGKKIRVHREKRPKYLVALYLQYFRSTNCPLYHLDLHVQLRMVRAGAQVSRFGSTLTRRSMK